MRIAPPPNSANWSKPRAVEAKRVQTIAWLAGATAAATAALILYAFPPGQAPLYPPCPLHAITGLQCPGCGGLRAAHHLLHGEVVEAWRLNPLAVLGTVGGIAWLGAQWLGRFLGRDLLQPFRRAWILWAALVGIAVFGIVRNLLPGR